MRLDYGTTLFRLGALENARAVYSRADEELMLIKVFPVPIGRAIRGLGARESLLHHTESDLQHSRKACDLYTSTDSEKLYFLALQNEGIARRRTSEREGIRLLGLCTDYWEGRDPKRFQSVMEEL